MTKHGLVFIFLAAILAIHPAAAVAEGSLSGRGTSGKFTEEAATLPDWGWSFSPLGTFGPTDHVYGHVTVFNRASSTVPLDLGQASYGAYNTLRNGTADGVWYYQNGFGRDEAFPWLQFNAWLRSQVLLPGQSLSFDFITQVPVFPAGVPEGSYSVAVEIYLQEQVPGGGMITISLIENTLTWNVGGIPSGPPSANFDWSPASPTAGQEIQFTDTSTGPPTSWEWNFGDGVTSSSPNPKHAFAVVGSHSVSLTATNAGGANSVTKTVTVAAASVGPVPDFTWSPTSPTAGQDIQFTDTSTESPTSWEWVFGDGVTSSSQNPKHAFAMVGSHSVSLTATNAGGTNSVTKTVTVAAASVGPVPDFTWSPASPVEGQAVRFTDRSTGSPTSWSWNFGDGGTSTSRDPEHSFLAGGEYSVELTATNTSGSNAVTRTVSVSAPTRPMTLTLLDPEADWPNGQFPSSPSSLEGGGTVCRGAATDGVTRLVVRAETSSAANITFSFANANPNFRAGRLFRLANSTPVNSLTVATTALPTGKHVAYSIYEVPRVFPSTSGSEWVFTLQARAEGNGFKSDQTTSVILIRPPLILLHGLNWENNGGATWDVRPFLPRYQVSRPPLGPLRTLFVPTYGGGMSFEMNRVVVPGQIYTALATVRASGFAARRADVVGHSMGGLLARRWAGESGYSDNIYRLITLDSPHNGSPWATMIAQWPSAFEVVARLFGYDAIPAIRNLAADKISLPRTQVWTHLIAGIDGADSATRDACSSRSEEFLSFVAWMENRALGVLLPVAFGSDKHDVIVSQSSQLGGSAVGMPYVTLMTGRDGIHMCNTTSLGYANRAIQLLNEDPSLGKFVAGLSGVNEFAAPEVVSGAPTARTEVDERLQIVVPAAGSTFSPGQPIGVELVISALTVQSVAFVTSGDVQIDTTAPFGTTLRAPAGRLGDTTIVALARLEDGTFAMSAAVPIVVSSGSPVSSLSVTPNSDLVLTVGDHEKVELSGVVSGTGANVMLDLADVTIAYSKAGIAEIVASELVAKSAGEVVITLRKDAARVDMRIVVRDRSTPPRRRPVRPN